jgi:hypothetical protein
VPAFSTAGRDGLNPLSREIKTNFHKQPEEKNKSIRRKNLGRDIDSLSMEVFINYGPCTN